MAYTDAGIFSPLSAASVDKECGSGKGTSGVGCSPIPFSFSLCRGMFELDPQERRCGSLYVDVSADAGGGEGVSMKVLLGDADEEG